MLTWTEAALMQLKIIICITMRGNAEIMQNYNHNDLNWLSKAGEHTGESIKCFTSCE